MANKDMKRYSMSLIIRKIQIKIIARCHLMSNRMAIIQAANDKCQQGYRQIGTFIHSWLKCKMVKVVWKTMWRLTKQLKFPYDPAIQLWVYTQRTESRDSTGHLYTPVHSSIIHSSQKV